MLVVVTIIVVLLALLVPAMDLAIYQTELAVCATNLHAIGARHILAGYCSEEALPGGGPAGIIGNLHPSL